MMIATTPFHELAHLAMSSCDPNLTVVGFYPFGTPQSAQNSHALSSVLGCVIVKERFPGAFSYRPVWADLLQEIICILIQMSISCYVTVKTLRVFIIPRIHRQYHSSNLING
jgi:hypothetical protein